MSRLDREHDVIELARELGLSGKPVEAIVGFCQSRIDGWVADVGGVRSVDQLEALVTERLQTVFEEFWSDDQLTDAIKKYTSQGEGAFASLRTQLDGDTFGSLMERRNIQGDACDRYVAFIDCRRKKGTRRFFTRWHEIAHVLTLTQQVELPAHRSTNHPIERLMDEVAGQVGFYDPLFRPIMAKYHQNDRLSFSTVDAIRQDYCSEASFQATLFACQRRLPTPVIYIEAQMGYKAGEQRQLNSKQMTLFEEDPPEAKLRVSMTVPNAAATNRNLQIIQKMRVPESSVIHRLFTNGEEESSGQENLNAWEFSGGGSLAECDVWIEARRLPDQVIAIVQPM